MKVHIFFLVFWFLGLSLSGQDIVYDSIVGNQSNWFRIKGGTIEKLIRTEFENQAIIRQSKVLSAAGLLENMEKGVDYVDYTFPYDTLTYEFKTDVPINVIVYKYYHNDTTYRYYVGFRKSILGANMFEGKYMFICPIVAVGSEIKIYDKIGNLKTLFFTLKPENMNDNLIGDYNLSNEITIQGIKVSRTLRASKTRGILTNLPDNSFYNIKIWPNPISDYINIRILNNKGVMVRLFDSSPTLKYQELINSDEIKIDLSSFLSGYYILVITDKKENIIEVIKIIKTE